MYETPLLNTITVAAQLAAVATALVTIPVLLKLIKSNRGLNNMLISMPLRFIADKGCAVFLAFTLLNIDYFVQIFISFWDLHQLSVQIFMECGLILCSVLGIPRSFYSLMRDHALLSLNCKDCVGISFVSVNVVCGIKLNWIESTN